MMMNYFKKNPGSFDTVNSYHPLECWDLYPVSLLQRCLPFGENKLRCPSRELNVLLGI